MPINSINPSTGQILSSFESLSDSQIHEKLRRGASAFPRFRKIPFADRAKMMNKAGEILEADKEDIARLATLEMGKTLRSARDEVAKCAWACRYYAEHGERLLQPESVATDARRSYICYEPIGVILAVMPWNFPFWQVFRFIAPNLMAGNVGLLKHASNVPQCALKIEEILLKAGFPEGVFQTLLVAAPKAESLLADDRIAAATLTGSENAGVHFGMAAAKGIKKVVLELGGSDPFIVMPSADLGQAVTNGVKSRTLNNGQSCISAKRFILHEEIADEFIERFVNQMKSMVLGDPMDAATELGPLATEDARRSLHADVLTTLSCGATVLTGGKPGVGIGNFYEPTVLVDIPTDSPAYREEFFGPVASMFPVAGADEAIKLANDSRFGLGASVWTNNPEEIECFAGGLEAGMVFVNKMVVSDPRLPFGGVKRSGHGRELAVQGIREFTNVKSVWLND